MTDIAEVALRLDSRELKQGQSELEKFGATGDKTSSQMASFGGVTTKAMGAVAIAATAAFGAIAAGLSFSNAISEARDFETTMFKIEAVIKATGGVAGRSADNLREQARQIAFSTLESTEGVLRAQQTLLTFRNVQGDIFDRTIKAAADMSAALGGDLNSATMQLAKALENPTEGLSALSRSGTVFTAAQKEMVKGMVAANDMAGAQAFILSELEAQYGGAATAATAGLAGAQDTLGQAVQEAKLAFVENTGALEKATSVVNATAGAVIFLTENMDALGIAIGIAALSGLPAVIAGLTGMTFGLGTASVSAIALGAALNLIPFVAVVTGATLLYRAYRDMSDTTGVTAAVTDTLTTSVEALNAALDVYSTQKSEPARQAVLQSAIAMEADARATLANVEAKRALAAQAGADNPLFMESANQPGGILSDLSLQITEANRQLENARMTIQGITRETGNASGAMAGLAGAAGGAVTEAEKMLASLNAQVEMQATISVYGKESAQVAALRAQQERDVFDATLSTLNATVEMKDQLRLSFSINQSLTAEVNATASAASGAASAAGGLAGSISQASAFAAQLVANLGQVPAAISAIAGQVDNAIGSLQSQNSSLTYQLEQGLTASSAAIKTQRDEALKLAAANGATIDQMAEMGQSFDAQAAKAENLANANTGMTKTLAEQAAAAAKAASAVSSGGGGPKAKGGGSGAAAKVEEPFFADTEKQVEALKRQIEYVGLSASAVAELKTKYDLLDEAKKRGMTVTDELSAQIEKEAAQVGNLTSQYDMAKEKMAALDQLSTQWKDSLIDAAMGVEGAFDGVIDAIKRAAVEYAIFGTGMFAGGGAGGGLAGGVIGGIGNFLAGKREGGGNVTAGKSYLVGERKPEVFTPTQSGRISQVGEGQKAQNITQTINIVGATGNSEIRQMVAQGVQQGNAQIRNEVPGIMAKHTKVSG